MCESSCNPWKHSSTRQQGTLLRKPGACLRVSTGSLRHYLVRATAQLWGWGRAPDEEQGAWRGSKDRDANPFEVGAWSGLYARSKIGSRSRKCMLGAASGGQARHSRTVTKQWLPVEPKVVNRRAEIHETADEKLRWFSAKAECVDGAARGDGDILLAIDGVRHGRCVDSAAHLEMPKRFPRDGIERDEVAFRVPSKNQSSCS